MKTIGLIFSLLVHGYSQLIFPDEYEPTNSAAIKPRRPFPILNNPLPDFKLQSSQSDAFNDAVTKTINLQPQDFIANEDKYWSNHVNNILSQGVTRFALHLNHAININQRRLKTETDQDNVIFSPLNLAGTLAVVLLGSGGKTFDEIVQILGFESGVDISGHSEIVHQMFGLLLNSIRCKPLITNDPGNPEVFFAGGIFIQEGYPIRHEFSTVVRNTYKNDIITVNFRNQPKAAQNLINNWVNSRTRGKVSSILPDPLDQDTKIILASALYFNGEWYQHFPQTATKRKPFNTTSEKSIVVDMMYNGGQFPFYEDKRLGVKILGLPYKTNNGDSVNVNPDSLLQHETTMYVLLPTSLNEGALSELESKLSVETINLLIDSMKNESCIIGMPKMKLSSILSLNNALQSLGLTSLFIPGVANLGLMSSGINTSNPNDFNFAQTDDEEKTTSASLERSSSRRKHYVRYEDTVRGYEIQQWHDGVYIKRNRRANRKPRQEMDNINNKSINSDYHPYLISDGSKDRIIALQGKKYNNQLFQRHKKEIRSIDDDFVKYIESKKFPSYGLDALRNSANSVNPGLYASDVIHRVEIDVTETGTSAASATGIILQRSGDQKRFVANRPFIFFIRHNPTKLILFWSTVYKPTPNYS